MEEKRVVISGIGAVSCVGNSVAAMWDSLLNGKSGIAPVTIFDSSSCKTQIAGEVQNFDPLQFVDAKDARRLDGHRRYAYDRVAGAGAGGEGAFADQSVFHTDADYEHRIGRDCDPNGRTGAELFGGIGMREQRPCHQRCVLLHSARRCGHDDHRGSGSRGIRTRIRGILLHEGHEHAE